MSPPAAALASLPYVTIDSAGTRCIDDALHVTRLDEGYRIVVAIADPSGMVAPGSGHDEAARRQGNTLYVRDHALQPMLPREISEHASSLVAGELRPAMLFAAMLNSHLEVKSFEVSAGVIAVAQRLTYEQIPAAVRDPSHPASEMLVVANTLANALLQQRRQHGALAFYDLARLLLADEEGNLQAMRSVEDVVGHILVQEMMILTNRLAADYAIAHDIPCLYRNHEARQAAPSSDKLAATVEGWIQAGSFDDLKVRERFSAIIGRAVYAPKVLGHYGLCLPAYMHVTSPLRRYADLLNMRQFAAHYRRAAPPHDMEWLTQASTQLNETITRQDEMRSESFKAAVRHRAEAAVRMGDVARLADHELRQAVKVMSAAGPMPAVLVADLVSRLATGRMPDSVMDCMLAEIPHEAIPRDLKAAISAWLVRHPPKASSMLNHGRQTGYLTDLQVESTGDDGAFVGTVRVAVEDGRSFEAAQPGARRRDAEQAAATIVLCSMMGLPQPGVSPQANPAAATPAPSTKGTLLELCQKHRWEAPRIAIQDSGPAHAKRFAARISVTVRGEIYTGEAPDAPSKREAEAAASRELLRILEPLVARPMPAPPQAAEDNPIGALQEYTQVGKLPMPEYVFEEDLERSPRFTCRVTVQHDTRPVVASGGGATKKDAKTQAAMAALAICSRVSDDNDAEEVSRVRPR